MPHPDGSLLNGGRDPGDRLFEGDVPPVVRRGFTPPLLAGLAAATLFAFVLAFFLVPSPAITDPSESRTRWSGPVRAESLPVRVANDAVVADPGAAPVVHATAAAPGVPDSQGAAEIPASAQSLAERGAGDTVALVATLSRAVPVEPGATQPAAPKPDPLVRRVQALLAEFGYQVGPVDGLAGKLTWSAIEQFRLDRDLALDEPLTVALVDQIEAAREAGWQPPSVLAGVFSGEVAAGTATEVSGDMTLQRLPGLRALAPPERHVLERWCTSGRNAADLEGYYRCLSDSLSELAADGPLDTLHRVDARQLASLRGRCHGGPHAAEPRSYFGCLREGLEGLTVVDGDARVPPAGSRPQPRPSSALAVAEPAS